MDRKTVERLRRITPTIAAAIGAAILGGCASNAGKKSDRPADATRTQDNRLLVRMALAENVYNGIAAERAVYPKDFLAGTATLNELGARRVETLVHASRGATGRINILRGDAPDSLYDARVEAVRQRVADAGINLDAVTVTKADHVGADGISSAQAILLFDRMLSDYLAKPAGGPAAAAAGSGATGSMQGGSYAPSSSNRNGGSNR